MSIQDNVFFFPAREKNKKESRRKGKNQISFRQRCQQQSEGEGSLKG
jgi:hypothetical protein